MQHQARWAPTCSQLLGLGAASFLQSFPCRLAVGCGRCHCCACRRQRALQQRRQGGHAAAVRALGSGVGRGCRKAGRDGRLDVIGRLLLLLQEGNRGAHIAQQVIKALGACGSSRGSQGSQSS